MCIRDSGCPTTEAEDLTSQALNYPPPFCISCAPPVHNRSSRSSDFFPHASPAGELAPCTRLSATSVTRCSIPVHSSHSAANIFLNCTKNTELTPRPFARTFTLALSIERLSHRIIGRLVSQSPNHQIAQWLNSLLPLVTNRKLETGN